MKFPVSIFFYIFLNVTYALYGQPCSKNSECKWEHEVCINGRCGCNDSTRSAWNYNMKHECDEWHIDRCKSDHDCGDRRFRTRICNKNNICECAPGEIYVGYVCYKIDKPNPKSFLKHCVPDLRFYGADEFEKKIYGTEVPLCHPEDNVFCSKFLKVNTFSDDPISANCICYPGFYGDNVTKLCRPKSEFLQANNLKEYKVKPGIYCFGDDDCIEGLNCKQNFCQCPDGCVYKETFESCDCGDYYDSDEYWDLGYVWPSIIGTVLGLLISCCWCVLICQTIDEMTPDKAAGESEEAQTLNHMPSEINQPVSVPLVEPSGDQPQSSVPPYAAPMADGNTYYPPGAPLIPPNSGPLPPYSLDSGQVANPSRGNGSDYNTNPLPYAPQPYAGPQPFFPHSSSSMYPGSFSEPPPSYSETIAQDAHQGQSSKQ